MSWETANTIPAQMQNWVDLVGPEIGALAVSFLAVLIMAARVLVVYAGEWFGRVSDKAEGNPIKLLTFCPLSPSSRGRVGIASPAE